MLTEWVDYEIFQKGLTSYLKTFAYSNTDTDDLWRQLEAASGYPVADVMRTWTQQSGFPLVTVAEQQEGNNRILTLSQKRFTSDGVLTDDDEKALWYIPLQV